MGEREAQTPTRCVGKVLTCAKMHSQAKALHCSWGETGKSGPTTLYGSTVIEIFGPKPNIACACACVISNHSERWHWYGRASPFEVWPYKWFVMSLDHYYILQANVLKPQELTVEIAWLICWRFSCSLFLDHLCVVQYLPQFSMSQLESTTPLCCRKALIFSQNSGKESNRALSASLALSDNWTTKC